MAIRDGIARRRRSGAVCSDAGATLPPAARPRRPSPPRRARRAAVVGRAAAAPHTHHVGGGARAGRGGRGARRIQIPARHIYGRSGALPTRAGGARSWGDGNSHKALPPLRRCRTSEGSSGGGCKQRRMALACRGGGGGADAVRPRRRAQKRAGPQARCTAYHPRNLYRTDGVSTSSSSYSAESSIIM